jgi:hypothetical protein
MSLRTKEQLAKIKPLSRFVEHFDLMPPTELLDEPSIEDSSIETKSKKKDKAQKKMTPLYALAPSFNKRPSKLSIKLAEQIPSNTTYSPVSPISPISPTNYTMELPLPGTVGRTQSNLSASSHQETLISDQEINVVDSIILNTSNSTNLPKITSSPSPSHSTSRNNFQTASRLDLNSFKQGTLLPKSQQPTSPRPSGGRVKYTRTSLNRGEVIIKRHESWDRFLSLISTWIADIVRLSIKSQKSSGNFMKASKSEMVSKQQGNTADLASLEEKKNFSQRLKVQLPILEKFRKECHAYIKTLKNRPDLNLEEFLKRAEITANLMAQLKTACEEARRTIEKGAQLTNDPWLVNLCMYEKNKTSDIIVS